jgi:hypothetical protein
MELLSATQRSPPVPGGGPALACVCELCTCGLHHCPRPTAPRVPFTATSSYAADFVAHPVCPVHKHEIVYEPRPSMCVDARRRGASSVPPLSS